MDSNTFTLVQFELDNDDTPLESDSSDINGNLMEFPTWDDAVEMARFIVEDPAEFPLVGICESRIDPDGEHVAWAAGWLQRETDDTVTVHDGDFDNKADWDSLVSRCKATL